MIVPISNCYDEYFIMVWPNKQWIEANDFNCKTMKWEESNNLEYMANKHGQDYMFLYVDLDNEEDDIDIFFKENYNGKN